MLKKQPKQATNQRDSCKIASIFLGPWEAAGAHTSESAGCFARTGFHFKMHWLRLSAPTIQKVFQISEATRTPVQADRSPNLASSRFTLLDRSGTMDPTMLFVSHLSSPLKVSLADRLQVADHSSWWRRTLENFRHVFPELKFARVKVWLGFGCKSRPRAFQRGHLHSVDHRRHAFDSMLPI